MIRSRGLALALCAPRRRLARQPRRPIRRDTLVIETEDRPRADQAAPRPRAQARRARQAAGQGRLLRRHQIPPRDRRLHGPDRRSEGHRHRAAPSYPDLPAEFTQEVFKRGSVGAARTADPNSANSQFFICFGDRCRSLNGQYTVWGEVIEGMEHVDKIAKGEPPAQPDVMQKVYLLADEK